MKRADDNCDTQDESQQHAQHSLFCHESCSISQIQSSFSSLSQWCLCYYQSGCFHDMLSHMLDTLLIYQIDHLQLDKLVNKKSD